MMHSWNVERSIFTEDIHMEEKKHKKINRKRQLHTRIALFTAGIVAVVTFVIRGQMLPGTASEDLIPPRLWSREEGIAHLRELARTNPEYEEICRQTDQYPDNLIGALCNNEEMLEYTKNYASTEKKVHGTLTARERNKKSIPLFMQWDARWGYAPYGDDVIALSGCGVTSFSMVLVGMTGNPEAAPNNVADYAMERGFYIPGVGTTWELMTEGAKHFGVTGTDIYPDQDTIFSLIKDGTPIICSMYPGDFTAKGHFVVLTGIEHGKIRLNDCMSKARSRKLWDWEVFEPQINHAWAFKKN